MSALKETQLPLVVDNIVQFPGGRTIVQTTATNSSTVSMSVNDAEYIQKIIQNAILRATVSKEDAYVNTITEEVTNVTEYLSYKMMHRVINVGISVFAFAAACFLILTIFDLNTIFPKQDSIFGFFMCAVVCLIFTSDKIYRRVKSGS